tara:strand:- start:299 stop:490 length:192 start_codon:yes stop_codon:yes gene_type:complete
MRVSKPGGSSVRSATAGRARAYVGAVLSVGCERHRDKGSEERASIYVVMSKMLFAVEKLTMRN